MPPPLRRAQYRARAYVLALAAQAERFDQGAIAREIFTLEVIKQTPTLADHLEQAATRVMIFVMNFKMLGQVQDALTEQCNLNLGRPSVRLMLLVFADSDCFSRW